MADVVLPQLGETVTEGTITKWFKAVGDTVAADEPLFEVSTDKVDTEVPSPTSGTLLEIKVNEGDTVPVGAVIAVVGDGVAVATDAPAAAAPAEAPPAAEAPSEPEPPAQAPTAGAPPAEAPAPEAPAPEAPAGAPAGEAAPPPPPPPPPPAPEPAAATTSESADESASQADNRLLSPVVRRLVNEHGLDPASITGTGAGGRITREDVLAHLDHNGSQPSPSPTPSSEAPAPAATAAPEQEAPAPAAPAPKAAPAEAAAPPPKAAPAPAAPAVAAGPRDEVVKLTKIRRLTGEHMVMSKSVTPHAFSVVEVDFANVDKTREAVKDEWKRSEGFSLTYLPFICRAIVDGLAKFPHLNASVNGGELVVHRYVDLGIAVDLDYEGLLVPVIRQADAKRLRAIAREISDLASRAKSRKLSPDEIQGGTFTVSNNGSAGSVLTAAIISQPQVAIISTDAIVRRPVVVGLADGSEGIGIHPVGNLAMSWDHRAFDGAYAANFLRTVKVDLESRDWSAEL
jgi:2-oxoglutarate dehydrogenase E2 component (dihydrolipoamide succinyltransferase)